MNKSYWAFALQKARPITPSSRVAKLRIRAYPGKFKNGNLENFLKKFDFFVENFKILDNTKNLKVEKMEILEMQI